jgi:hypothetical protein
VLLGPHLVAAYYDGPGGKATREALGFELQRASVDMAGGSAELLVFANVRADGRLGRAGVRDGDTWVELAVRTCGNDQRSDVVRLYEYLEYAAEHRSRFAVLPVTALSKQAAEPWWRSVRSVFIPPVPSNRGGA